ncbi:hypothetical protein PS1_026864 [Malus domestica]
MKSTTGRQATCAQASSTQTQTPLGSDLSFPLYKYPKTARSASSPTSYSLASSFNSNRGAATDDDDAAADDTSSSQTERSGGRELPGQR